MSSPGRRADVIRHCPSPTLCVSWLDVTGCDCYGYPMDLWISSGDLCQTANLAGWCWNLLKWFRNVDSQSLGKWLLHGFCGSVNLWHMVSLTPLLELREWERGVSYKISTDQLPAPQLHVPHMLHCEILTSISHAFFSQSGLYYIYIYVYNSCDYILYLSNRRRLLVTWFICDSIGNAFAMLSNGSAISIF